MRFAAVLVAVLASLCAAKDCPRSFRATRCNSAEIGERCFNQYSCVGGNPCSGEPKVCVEYTEEGKRCENEKTLTACQGIWCRDNKCIRYGEDGDSCASDLVCLELTCRDGKCVGTRKSVRKLSTGSKVGVIVGGVVGVLCLAALLLGLVVWLVRRERRREMSPEFEEFDSAAVYAREMEAARAAEENGKVVV